MKPAAPVREGVRRDRRNFTSRARGRLEGRAMQYILFPHIAGDERRRQIDLHTCLSLAEHREGGPFAKSQRGSYFCRGRSASVFVSDMFFATYRGCVRMPCGWRRPSAASRAYRECGDARLSCEMRFRSRHLSQVHGFGREGRWRGAFFPRALREVGTADG